MPSRKQSSAPVEGLIAAAISPRRAQEYSIDLGATLELIDFLGNSGVQGIALLGSTGEFVHFALDDRRHMVNFAARRSPVPLLVNVSHSMFDGAVELAREAANCGVAGVLLMPPYYFRYSQEAIRAFYLAFAAEAGRVPIYLYNIPAFTNEIAISTATELLATGLFAGIKDSSGSLDYFQALRAQANQTPFTILAGYERIYVASRLGGAHGTISGISCAVPELMVAIENAVLARDQERIQRLETLVFEFLQRIEAFPLPAGIKEALKQRKLKTGALAVPLGAEADRKLAEFGEWFRGWLPEVLAECGK